MPANTAPATRYRREHSANSEAIECWNETLTPKWIRFRHLLSGNGQIHSDRAYAGLAVRPGQRALDVACGFGETTLELAQRVGPHGSVVGLDCTHAFLEIARREQRAHDVRNVEYRLADIETAALTAGSFDVAVSRFGIMFCASPVRALRAIARALVSGGSVGLITWRRLAENPCWSLAEQVALRHLPRPGDQAQSCGPGPFALSDRDTNERIMAASGFTSVTSTQLDAELCIGRTVDEAIEYQMLVGPAGFVIREAGEAGARAIDTIRNELRELMQRHRREDGSVWMGSSTWFIQGRTAGG
jgi:ubiquinone/menaquinone biosynthesis C-methylase UbiE